MKNSKSQTLNMVLSAFLVVAYVLCAAFFKNIIEARLADNAALRIFLTTLILIVFGLLLFYATRCGEGKQVKRFSLPVLLLMVVPGLYISLVPFAQGLPLYDFITHSTMLSYLGAVMLGYGIPYTFLAGYERTEEEASESAENDGAQEENGEISTLDLDLQAIAEAEEAGIAAELEEEHPESDADVPFSGDEEEEPLQNEEKDG